MKIEVTEKERYEVEMALRAWAKRLREDADEFDGAPGHDRLATEARARAVLCDALADRIES